jgi:hypothetical protein
LLARGIVCAADEKPKDVAKVRFEPRSFYSSI